MLEAQKSKPRQFVDDEVPREHFIRLYALRNPGITLDQAGAVAERLKSVWMERGDVSCHTSFALRHTIFNALLHFTTQVLLEHNSQPVCKYEHLLRWHDLSSLLSEDLLTTSFLAARDLYYRTDRKDFNWPTVIDHDNRALNSVLKRPITDLHFHLNGSSLNFEVNWMCLMNKIGGRNEAFEKLSYRQQEAMSLTDHDQKEPFYLQVIKAAALRMLLFEYAIGHCQMSGIANNDRLLAQQLLDTSQLTNARGLTQQLDAIFLRLRHLYGKRYTNGGEVKIPDYATMDSITLLTQKSRRDYVFTVLSGERWLMYTLFREIYEHSKSVPKEIVAWFYAYLLIKAQFRMEFVQMNSLTGFANFANYEKRKSHFIADGTVYATLLSQMAAESFLGRGEQRHLEARIVPKSPSKKLQRFVNKTDRAIRNPLFQGATAINNENIKFVLHFIKRKDEKPAEDAQKGHCRHYDLRYAIKRQAQSISSLRKRQCTERNRLVGIDAANSEVFARPEVFAQAFRFLRDDMSKMPTSHCPNDLGMTYHVGEDFMDVVDGLRAVDEVIHFLGFRNGDRLGHGLVLGIDVEKYYAFRHQTVMMQVQTLLDNAVWLYNVGKDCPSFAKAGRELEILYEKYFQQVYGKTGVRATLWDYYQSWLLRGDRPSYYYPPNLKRKHSVPVGWNLFSLNHDADADVARKNTIAKKLYELYHYDRDVRENARANVQEKLTVDVVRLIGEVQEKMLEEVERKNLCIECNPTSNLCIATIEGYSTHPIVRFFGDMLSDEVKGHCVSVSVNTDDKGIFATSLEREYSLLALSLEKNAAKDKKLSPRNIYEWLDKIRQMGLEQRFE